MAEESLGKLVEPMVQTTVKGYGEMQRFMNVHSESKRSPGHMK
jgi:hypothetical protein